MGSGDRFEICWLAVFTVVDCEISGHPIHREIGIDGEIRIVPAIAAIDTKLRVIGFGIPWQRRIGEPLEENGANMFVCPNDEIRITCCSPPAERTLPQSAGRSEYRCRY